MKQLQPKAFLASSSTVLLDLYHNISYRNSVRKLARIFQRGWGMQVTSWKVQVTVSSTNGNFQGIFLSFVNCIFKGSPNVWVIISSHLEFTLFEVLRRKMLIETTLSSVITQLNPQNHSLELNSTNNNILGWFYFYEHSLWAAVVQISFPSANKSKKNCLKNILKNAK